MLASNNSHLPMSIAMQARGASSSSIRERDQYPYAFSPALQVQRNYCANGVYNPTATASDIAAAAAAGYHYSYQGTPYQYASLSAAGANSSYAAAANGPNANTFSPYASGLYSADSPSAESSSSPIHSPQSPPSSAHEFSPSSANDIPAVSDIPAANESSASPPPLTSVYNNSQTTADCTSSLNRPTYAMTTAYQYSPSLGFYSNISSLSLTSSGTNSSSSDLSSSPTPAYSLDLGSGGGYAASTNNVAQSACTAAAYVPPTTSIYPVPADYSSQYSSVSMGYHHHHHHSHSSSFPLLSYPYPKVSYDNPRYKLTPERARALIDWFEDHKTHPYPTRQEKMVLCRQTQLTFTQVSTWFANARRRMKKASQEEDDNSTGDESSGCEQTDSSVVAPAA